MKAYFQGIRFIFLLVAVCVWAWVPSREQARVNSSRQAPATRNDTFLPQPEAELQTGIRLTRRGAFAEAIPHFLAARGQVSEEFAADFNLALCYVGTAQFSEAIKILNQLRAGGHREANVENLLAQSYAEAGDSAPAFAALQRSASLEPKNEKLYLFVADSCLDRQDYSLGLKVAALGLEKLPNSARLHYQRAYFLSMLNEWDAARNDFDLASSLEPHSEIAYVAGGQKNLLAGNLSEAIRITRSAVREGHANYLSLTILGEALIHSGASPGEAAFAEAESALQNAVAVRPNFANAQILLGYLLLTKEQVAAAVEHLEKGRALSPNNPAVYSHLAVAYRKLGETEKSERMLATLARLNTEEILRINSISGERRAIP